VSNEPVTLRDKFKDPEYRDSYIEAFYDTLIALQLRSLRGEMTQRELAERTSTSQSTISSFESEDYSKWSIPTLRKFAREFDVAVQVRFVSFGEALEDCEAFGDADLDVASFSDDPYFSEDASSIDLRRGSLVSRISQFKSLFGDLRASEKYESHYVYESISVDVSTSRIELEDVNLTRRGISSGTPIYLLEEAI